MIWMRGAYFTLLLTESVKILRVASYAPNAADERGIIKSRGVHCRLESGPRSLEEDRRVCIASFSAPALSYSLFFSFCGTINVDQCHLWHDRVRLRPVHK